MKRFALLTLAGMLLGATAVSAQDEAAIEGVQRGPAGIFADADGDGINDNAPDTDGDGVINHLDDDYAPQGLARGQGARGQFVDADGDGVNDRDGSFADRDEDGVCDNVIDHDGDGMNDITGAKYTEKSLQGERYGRVDEARGLTHHRFVDEDGDGMHDLRPRESGGSRAIMDRFVDEDGDGIHDGRAIRGRSAPMEPHGREYRGSGHGREDGEAGRAQHGHGEEEEEGMRHRGGRQ